MRALLVDHDAPLLEPLARAVRDFCRLELVASAEQALERLRQESIDIVIVGDRLAQGGFGLDLLRYIVEHYPPTLRAYAAEPRKLTQLRARLASLKVFQTVPYPLAPTEIRAMLKSAQAAQAANADTMNVQHIVLEGDAAVTAPSLELAPEWRAEDSLLVSHKKIAAPERLDIETPEWTVEGSEKPAPAEQPGRILGATQRVAALRNDSASHSVRPVQGLGASHGSQDAVRGMGSFQNLAHSRAMQAAALAETKVVASARASARRVVVVLTRDKDCLDATIAALAGRAVSVTHVGDEAALALALRKHGAIAVLVDVGLVNGSPRRFLEKICLGTAETPVLAVGRAIDTSHIAPMLARGAVQRFLVKPMNRAQTRSAFEAVLAIPADEAAINTREAVPFASLIDRVTATDLRASMNNVPLRVKLVRAGLKHWHWALGGAVLGLSAMLALAFALS